MMRPVDTKLSGVEMLVTSDPLLAGVVNRFHQRALPEGACQELLNLDLSDPVTPVRRDGYGLVDIGQGGLSGLTTKRIGGLAWFNPSEGDRFLLISIPSGGSGKLYQTKDPVSLPWLEVKTATGGSVDMGADDLVSFQANDKLWLLPGGGGFVTVVGNDGIAIKSTGLATDAPSAIDGCYMLGRVFLLFGNKVAWPFQLLPVTPIGGWNLDTQALSMSPNRGARPVAIRAWRDSNLIVFFDLTIEEMIVAPADPSDSIRNVIEPAIGCCSRASVVPLGDDFYFADQWGQIRSLKRSDLGSNNGVIATPISEPIKGEIPGRVNHRHLDKMRSVVLDDHLEIYYPRDASTQANARMIYEFSTQSWHGPHVFADEIGQLVVSGIRGTGEELYSTNGSATSPAAEVFLWNQGTFTDNGEAIECRETTRSMDLGFPEASKVWRTLEVELYGQQGIAPTVLIRTQEDGDFAEIEALPGTLPFTDEGDFPLLPTRFPLLPEDFPLVTVPSTTRRFRYRLDSDVASPSRCLEVQIAESTAGLTFERRAWRVTATVNHYEPEPTDD